MLSQGAALTKHLQQNILAIRVEFIGLKFAWKRIYKVPAALGLTKITRAYWTYQHKLNISCWLEKYKALIGRVAKSLLNINNTQPLQQLREQNFKSVKFNMKRTHKC